MYLKQCCLLSVVLLIAVLGCYDPWGSEYLYYGTWESEHLGLTNSEFAEVSPAHPGYPGASRIDTKLRYERKTPGRSDSWTKVTISKAHYEALWSSEAELVPWKWKLGHTFTLARAADGRSLGRLLTDEPLVPPDWSDSQSLQPSWWQPPTTGTPTEITAWEYRIGEEDESGTCYANCGRYWVYDTGLETLWIWSWSDRH